ncbi:MAG TPA: hypothetical protein VJ872_17190 [Nocardioides sp.]|nr:hypothetical protein [Nocardioides sp.]
MLKLLKARGFKARRGHLRLAVGELFWYVDLRIDGVGPSASLLLEVGCWTPLLPPEPDGGAVDCPLLVDVAVSGAADVEALVGRVSGIGTLASLRDSVGDFPGVLVDRRLRELLG